MGSAQYSIVMFAYNEQENIIHSVSSAFEAADENLEQLYVIANGCTDNTVSVLETYRLEQPQQKLTIVELNVGDKCNAWNHYVHHLAPHSSETHFFTDADVQFVKGSFARMTAKLAASPDANAVAGLPFSGRNREKYLSFVRDRHCLFGNCYGLSRTFIELIKEKSFRLPVGLGWIDSAITRVVNSNLIDIANPNRSRVVYDENSGYYFESLSPFSKRDLNLYFSRIIRYRLGKMQEKYLEKIGYLEWPKTLFDINNKVLEDIEADSSWYNLRDKYFVKNRISKQNKKLSAFETDFTLS